MRLTQLTVLVTLALSTTLASQVADAQTRRRRAPEETPVATGPTQQARDQAREAYGRGQAAFQAGNFSEAEAAFRAAYDAVPNPVVFLSIAETQERMERYSDALATLERYLAERADAPDRASVQARIAALRARPATLNIVSTPAGAAITIDGEATGRTTPASIEVPAGERVVVLTLRGHRAATENVTAVIGTRHSVSTSLERQSSPTPAEGPSTRPSEDDVFGSGSDTSTTPSEGEEDVEGASDDEDVEAPASGGGNTAAWIAAGVGGVGLVAGTVLGFLALQKQSDFDEMPSDGTADDGEQLALFADVAFGVAAAATLTALVLFITDDDTTAERADEAAPEGELSISPILAPTAAGVAASLRF